MTEETPYTSQKAQGGPSAPILGAPPSFLDPGAIRRARWVQNGPNTLILKCCVKDGSAVLARVTEYHFFLYHWSLSGQDIGGKARSRYAAMRRVRKAVRELPAARQAVEG